MLLTPDTLHGLDGVLPLELGGALQLSPARAELRLDHDQRVRGLVVGEHVGGRLREGHRVFRVKLTAIQIQIVRGFLFLIPNAMMVLDKVCLQNGIFSRYLRSLFCGHTAFCANLVFSSVVAP